MPIGLIDAISGGNPDYGAIFGNLEKKRQQAITTGTAAIDNAYSGFNPAFYKQREQDYIDFARPQVAGQYRNAQSDIGFNLANRGLMHGSAANKQWGALAQNYNQAQQNLTDEGTRQAQALESQVNQSKQTQEAFLYQSADATKAAQQSTAAAASLRTPSTFGAVADQFQGLLNTYYYSQLVNAYKPTSFVSLPPQQQSSGLNTPSGYSVGQ